MRAPFSRIPHLDLLHGARRLWRLRLDSCKLVDLESRILGHERQGDVPGELIPQLYFDYLRGRGPAPIEPVFEHNALDIISLACLTGVVPWAFRDPSQPPVHHGAECVSLGRWLRQSGKLEEALGLFRRGVNGNLPDDLLFRTLWDIAALEKKLGRYDAALAVYTDLAQARNAYRALALEELAKYYEHRERNFAMALELTLEALRYDNTAALQKRAGRLRRRSMRAV
jgi:tetratricopeptide (TPR) repeat protein